ncbi:putative integral membrane protein [Biscogniauxia sp. FL1348]|nr:putative integral membrane protein [Biscogniauxia sp. FL1348]
MATDEARKARIIEHMNEDHTVEMSQYLRAYNGLSASAASKAQLQDITLSAMTIRSASGTHAVAIEPAMDSLADAGERLVAMSLRAQAQLGLSDIRIHEWTRPAGLGLATFAGVSLYMASAAALAAGLVAPGTAAWDLLDARFFPSLGGGAAAYVWLVRALFVPTVVTHVLETWWMVRGRLVDHSVVPGSAVWWLWTANTFVEGYPCMRRFDRLVVEKRQKFKELMEAAERQKKAGRKN